MSDHSDTTGRPPKYGPPANAKTLRAIAAVLLVIPIVALMLVPTYAKEDPHLGGFPFFVWYQFLWVFICSALTWTAHILVLKARGTRSKDGEK